MWWVFQISTKCHWVRLKHFVPHRDRMWTGGSWEWPEVCNWCLQNTKWFGKQYKLEVMEPAFSLVLLSFSLFLFWLVMLNFITWAACFSCCTGRGQRQQQIKRTQMFCSIALWHGLFLHLKDWSVKGSEWWCKVETRQSHLVYIKGWE